MISHAALNALYFTGTHLAFRPFVGGVGAILALHHVRPARRGAFQPLRLREITPAFLETVIVRLRRANVDLISLDEMRRRLAERTFWRRFVCFTFDGGYRDTLLHAYPVLRRHHVPFAVYVPTSFPDRLGELWWFALEAVVGRNDRVTLVIGGAELSFDCATPAAKREVFATLHARLRALATEAERRACMHELCSRYRVDLPAFCAEHCMTWPDIAELAADPLATIGAATVSHPVLRGLTDDAARSEIANGAAVLTAALGAPVRHFAYPWGEEDEAGAREFALAGALGFDTAVTARPGVLFPEHRDHLAALPRIALDGEFQRMRHVRVMLSGAPTGIHNRFRRINAA